MKKLSFIVTVLFLALHFNTQAQQNGKTTKSSSNTPPSDAAYGYTYDFDKTQALIFNRLTAPSEANKDATPLLAAKDFPAYSAKEGITAEYKNKVRIWMEANPDLIINSLKHRTDIVQFFAR